MTLTEVSYYSRKFAPFALLVFIVLLIFFYSFKLFFLYLELNKPKVVNLNPVFKQIRTPWISEATTSAGYSFTLDTIEGQPVTATDTAKVYFLPKNQVSFGYQQKIYLIAKTIGFDIDTVQYKLLNDTEALFEQGSERLRIDITNFNFKYDYDIQHNPGIFDDTTVIQKEDAQQKATDFLKSFDRYPPELAKGKVNIVFLQFDKTSSSTAVLETSQNANMVEVDFYRPDISDFPVVSPKYFNSQNYVTLAMTPQGYRVVSAQIKYFEPSEEQIGLYPVITGQEAYDNLKSGNAILVSPTTGRKDIAIKKMFMGYFDPDEYQEYLQPVYVFLGEDGFVAYVPALTSQWLVDPEKL